MECQFSCKWQKRKQKQRNFSISSVCPYANACMCKCVCVHKIDKWKLVETKRKNRNKNGIICIKTKFAIFGFINLIIFNWHWLMNDFCAIFSHIKITIFSSILCSKPFFFFTLPLSDNIFAALASHKPISISYEYFYL